MFVWSCRFLFDTTEGWTIFQIVDAEHRTPKGVPDSSSFAIYKHSTPPE